MRRAGRKVPLDAHPALVRRPWALPFETVNKPVNSASGGGGGMGGFPACSFAPRPRETRQNVRISYYSGR
jgi:hypothetical protein